MKIQVSIDAADILKKLDGAPGQMQKALKVWSGESSQAVEREAKRIAPRRSGKYRASIHGQIRGTGSATVTSNSPIAKIIEDGSRPHTIFSKRGGKVLAFKRGGATVFARRINHPGTKAQRVLHRAQDAKASFVRRRAKELVDQYVIKNES